MGVVEKSALTDAGFPTDQQGGTAALAGPAYQAIDNSPFRNPAEYHLFILDARREVVEGIISGYRGSNLQAGCRGSETPGQNPEVGRGG